MDMVVVAGEVLFRLEVILSRFSLDLSTFSRFFNKNSSFYFLLA